MPVIKIQNNLSGDNKGSSKNSVSYLGKEQRFRDKSERTNEGFFNQKGTDFKPEEVVKKLDSKRGGLKKTVAKYYSLTIAPSQRELKNLSDSDLKDYAKDFMKLYADHFGKNINPNDLVWFGKLEKKRKYKFVKAKNQKPIPPGKKAGQFKDGDQRHIHILVRKKTELNIQLSPLVKARESKDTFGKGIKMGFDRVKFFEKCDALMVKYIEKINPSYRPTSDDFFGDRYLKSKNYNFKEGIRIGITDETLMNVKIKSMKYEKPELFKPTKEEIQEKAKEISHHFSPNKTVGGVQGSKELTSKEKIEIAADFHLQNKYTGKINNISNNPKPLIDAVEKEHNFTLTEDEAKEVHQTTKGLEKGKGYSPQ